MSIVSKVFLKIYEQIQRKRLRTKQFSIICSNCMGGVIYHRLGVQFQSPTINQFMSDKDFIRFAENLDGYLAQELKDNGMGDGATGNHPKGLLGDIPISFTHYKTAQQAINAWNRRKERVDRSRLYLILFDTIEGEISKEDILRFGKIKCANHVCLSIHEYPDIDWVITIPRNRKDKNNHYMASNFLGLRRFETRFDYVKWINDGIGRNE